MAEKLVVGPIEKGMRNNRLAFNIDNDNFPKLVNAFQWRGRVKRKRGTQLIGQLNRSVSISVVLNLNSGQDAILPNFPVVPGSINLVGSIDGTTYTDPNKDSTLTATGGAGTGGTINYASGLIHINAGGGETLTGTLSYYPMLPVMGLEEFAQQDNSFPQEVAFDTTYAYNISTTYPWNITSVSWYANPAANASTLPGYIPKSTLTPLQWNGQDYQQFWTTNYQGAMWATNGITTPFTTSNIGMQFKRITTVNGITAGPPAFANLTIAAHGLLVGDFVFVNEVQTTTGINFQTGYVTVVVNANEVTVEFPFATIATNGSGGIAQYLTSSANTSIDCIRWYNGIPNTAGSPPTGPGWVNFMPPISQAAFGIGDAPAATYYLVGARMIVPFKDRLLFIGPVVQTSSVGAVPIYLQDTVVYSQNGTPYYTASFTAGANYPLPPVTTPPSYSPVLVPTNQTATPSAYFDDSAGFGGNVTSGLDQPIITVSANEDVLLMGFNPNYQVRFVYTGNDIIPFNFYIVNSELGSASTFSAITMDQAVISRGPRGYTMASQTQVSRFDLDIPDEVFEINLSVNGNERFCAQRDFINEWIYFTYPGNQFTISYPNTTLQYNYRDNSWAIFYENYTTYGVFREKTGETWEDLNKIPWNDWNETWESGSNTLLAPQVIAGNQQGFILKRTNETFEDTSLYIQNISMNQITSNNHCLNNGDYITITGALGTVGSTVNGMVFSVFNVGTNTFRINPSNTSGTYLGCGYITRFYVPFIQTKQFPMAWGDGRKTRIGVQRYLLSKTTQSQITVNMYLSQDDSTVYNQGPVIPADDVTNSALIYSQIVYTCPESTNLGLTPANSNLLQLNQVASSPLINGQQQIWHRSSTSLIGDTVQLGFTMSDAQMRDPLLLNQTAEIELHSFCIDLSPSQELA